MITFSTLISACANAGGKGHKAVEVFDIMTRRGVRPDAIAYKALLAACAGRTYGATDDSMLRKGRQPKVAFNGHLETAMRIYRAAHADGFFQGSAAERVAPDSML